MKKNRCLTNSNYIFLFILLICYGGSIANYICLLFENYGDHSFNENLRIYKKEYFTKTFIIINILILIFIFFSTTLFACYSNCFLSQCILLFYIISLMLMIMIELPSFLIILEYILFNLNQLAAIIVLIFVFNILEVVLGFVSILISLALRNLLIEEIERSPLNFIDLNMTENMYNNILNNSRKNNHKIRANSINSND